MTETILITGVTGMVGSHLADHIIKQGSSYKVVGTKRWRSSLDNISHLNDKIQVVDADLTDLTACLELIGKIRPDKVFHLAAQSVVPDSWKSPHATLNDNINMQLNLFEAIRHHELDPLVQIALSSEEYGKVEENELPIDETNELRPLSPYAVSKVAQDMLAYQYHQSYKLRVIRTRAFNHEGPRRGEVFVTSNFAKQIAEIELGLKEPTIRVGNLSAERDWTDVRDMVRAYWLSIDRCEPGELYVIASGVGRTVQSMLDLLLSLSSKHIDVSVDASRMRPSDVQLLRGNSAKFRKATGWSPEIPFETTMLDLLNYWRSKIASQQGSRALA